MKALTTEILKSYKT